MDDKIDIEFIKDSYSRMPDYELIRIATQGAQGLTPEAQEILTAEIIKRRLSTNLVNSVAVQNTIHTEQDIADLCSIVQKLPCPSCGSSIERLNAILTVEVISAVFFTTCEKKLRVACPTCLSKANTNAYIKSVLLGWWGIPEGIVRTISAITASRYNKKELLKKEPTQVLESFALGKRGVIECYKDEPQKLKNELFHDLTY